MMSSPPASEHGDSPCSPLEECGKPENTICENQAIQPHRPSSKNAHTSLRLTEKEVHSPVSRTESQNGIGDKDRLAHQETGLSNSTSVSTPLSQFGSLALFSPWIPKTDPSRRSSKFSDRETALMLCLVAAGVVFLFNLAITLVPLLHSRQAFGDVYAGNCGTTQRLDTLLHLFINILSTILLGASNYTAQILVAPTRKEVDDAHSKKDWLDIGVPSTRNLWRRRIDNKRKVLWVCLMLTTLPLHLFWNSVVFSTIPVSNYLVALMTSDAQLDQRPWQVNATQAQRTYGQWDFPLPELQPQVDWLQLQFRSNSLERLDKVDCISRYINARAGAKDLIVVSANQTMKDQDSIIPGYNSSSLIDVYTNYATSGGWVWYSSWLCTGYIEKPGNRPTPFCTEDFLAPRQDSWTLFGFTITPDGSLDDSYWSKVDFCLSAGQGSMENECTLRYSFALLLLVSILNLTKVICIGITWKLYRRQQKKAQDRREKQLLDTLGNAIASFIEIKDVHTAEMNFVGREDFLKKQWPGNLTSEDARRRHRQLQEPLRWYLAASLKRWVATIFLFAFVLAVDIWLLLNGLGSLRGHKLVTSLESLWNMGLGSPQPYANLVLDFTENLGNMAFYGTAIVANLYQIVFSAIYLVSNSLLSTFLVSQQWASFIIKRKSLRLSDPRGIQRSSYTLSLPYRYGVPMTIASGLMHWLISQSIFVIQTRGFSYSHDVGNGTDTWTRNETLDASTLGYSTIGQVLCIVLTGILLPTLVALGWRKFPSRKADDGSAVLRMPLASTCSAAISAACHRPPEDEDAHLLPVQWGCTEDGRWCFTTARTLTYPGPDEERETRLEKSSICESPSVNRIERALTV